MISIRTQDRMSLVPYDKRILISIRDGLVKDINDLKRNTLVIVCPDGVYKELGTYATKERALEVLDEIEEILFSNAQYENNKYLDINPDMFYRPVYQMPKE